MSNYTPLHIHSHNSLLDGLSKTSKIVDRIKMIGSDACAISDHGVLSGNIDFYKDMTKAGKKPILGCELYICDQEASKQEKDNRSLTHLVVLAKNRAGWKNLIKLVSESNKAEHFYHRPRLSLKELGPFAKDLITFSGHLGSHLANDLFIDHKLAYKAQNLEDARSILHTDYRSRIQNRIKEFQDLFGKENFFLEVQLFDKERLPAQQVVTEILREIGTSIGVKCVATPDAHYANREDAFDQRVLLCSALQTTFPQVEQQLAHNEDVSLGAFFKSDRYYIPSYEDMIGFGHTQAELEVSNEIASLIDKYDVLSKPVLPEFGSNPDEHLRQLCRDGWRNKITNKIPKADQQIYVDRVKYELSVLQGAGLSSYFLTLNDICNYIKSQNWLPNVGRGCLHPNTQIRTDSGLKDIKNVNIGDLVYTKNGSTNKILNKFEYDCKEELIEIETYQGDIAKTTVTADHKILCEKYIKKNYWTPTEKPTGKLEWIKAEDISKNDWVVLPIPDHYYQITSGKLIDIGEYCHDRDDLRITKTEIFYEPKNILCNTIQFSRSISRLISINEDLVEFIGYFTGDGWFDKENKIAVVYHNDDKKLADKHINLFKSYGIEATIAKHKTKKLFQVYFPHKALFYWFKNLFNKYENSSQTKHVPKLIFTLDKKLIAKYIHGYSLADGSHADKKSTRVKFTTTSIILSEQIRELLLILGIPSSRYCLDRRGQKNITSIEYYINCPVKNIEYPNTPFNKGFSYYIKDNLIYLQVKNINKINNPSNKVYDIEVENEHNYCTNNFIVHNSAAGCLVSYLINITQVDPIKYGLIFERFYNAGRNTKDRVSMPDIDLDVPADKRDNVIGYIKSKFGENKVGQISAFQTMKGRGALKEVLRAYGSTPFETMNRITEHIPDEQKIIGDLQIMKEEEGISSIIKWALENEPEKFYEWCKINDDGTLEGPLAKRFEQAIRLEGTRKSHGKHASGVVVSAEPLGDVCPLVLDKDKHSTAGYEMNNLEDVGLVKFDILGVNLLSKLQGIRDILKTGDI